MTIGKRIETLRRGRDMSRSQLAEAAGVTAAAIWQLETDGRLPGAKTLRGVCLALGVSADVLLGLSAERVTCPFCGGAGTLDLGGKTMPEISAAPTLSLAIVTLREIVADWLRQRGYDGLSNDVGGCACDLADLMPCNEPGADCRPGHYASCDCGEHCAFHIASTIAATGAGTPDLREESVS